MTTQEHLYRRFREAGMTTAGASATLGQIQFESAFRPNNAEDSKGIADEVYTAQVDSGERTRHQFSYDGIGYGYAQWTEPTRKGRMYDFHRARGKSIGDSETQIQYLLWEMKNYFPSQWKLITSSSDLKACTWELLDKWENPKEKTNNMANRYQAAQNFFKMFSALTLDGGSSAMTADEAIAKVLDQARAELGYHEKASNVNLDDKTANSGAGNWTKYARDLAAIGNFYNGNKNGYAWCFTSGTLILTDEGYKNIEDIRQGDRVLNANGDGFNNVIAVSSHEADVIDVRVYGCAPFSVTPDHPFLAEKRINKWHRNFGYESRDFYPISELDIHDVVSMPKSPILYGDFLSYDDLWVLGYYAGDGFYSHGHYKVCANDEKSRELEKHIDGRKEAMYDSRTCIEYELHLSGHEVLFDVLNKCGLGAVNKTVPACVLFGTSEAKRAFLDGYFAADGCAAFNTFNSVSKSLVTGISRLLYDLGVPCTINTQERSEEGRIFDYRKNEYRCFKQQPVIFNCHINNNQDRGRQLHTEYERYNLVPIREKSETTRRDVVYTISTDGDHTYTANNIAVHNCDVFVDWLFVKCFGAEIGRQMVCQPYNSAGAGCLYSAQYYKQAGRWTNDPKPGNQIFFTYSAGEVSHTGIVEAVSSGMVTVIEGNSSDQVSRRTYSTSSASIYGYGRPRWELASNSEVPVSTTISSERILRMGVTGDDVKELQEKLMKLGYDLGKWGADGDFGTDTYNAVKKFQAEHGLNPVDGEVGPDTRKALESALNTPKPKQEETVIGPITQIPFPNIQVREIKMEDEGSDVKLAQAALQCWGYTIFVTGIFGKEMDEKIRHFQKAKGLEPDGEIGLKTWKELLKV